MLQMAEVMLMRRFGVSPKLKELLINEFGAKEKTEALQAA